MHGGFFVTGTDTGVGKTIITVALIQALRMRGIRACGMKPIETGCGRDGSLLRPSDGMAIRSAAGMDDPISRITPFCFETPAAPLAASEREGREIDIGIIKKEFRFLRKAYQTVVVEGVGGLLVPIKRDYSVLDLAKELDLPLVVVSRHSLGTINHTLLTVNYALERGMEVLGIIMNCTTPPEGTYAEKTNPDILRRLSPAPLLGVFPYLHDPTGEILGRTVMERSDIEALLKKVSPVGERVPSK